MLVGGGLACGILYCWHARHTEHPIIELSLLRTQTFAVATIGGNLCRFDIGASPFLLAILLQVGFGLSQFSAGMITFTSAAGAIVMKLAIGRESCRERGCQYGEISGVDGYIKK